GDCSVQRLLYNPGHRATFLLSSPRSAQKLILKIVRPDAFVACLDKIEAIECSVLHARIALPRLSSYALQEHVLLYEYLPGQGIDKLEADGAANTPPWLYKEVASLLAEIHLQALPMVSQWSPAKEFGKTRMLIDDLELRQPEAAAAIRPVFD